MNDFKGVNWVGVIVAAILGWLIGAAWYGFIFAEAWMALTGILAAQDGSDTTAISMILGFVQTLIIMTGLGWLISRTDGGWMGGFKIGLMAAVFFALTTSAYNFIYVASEMGLLPIDWGHLLLVYGVGGAVIGGLRIGRKA